MPNLTSCAGCRTPVECPPHLHPRCTACRAKAAARPLVVPRRPPTPRARAIRRVGGPPRVAPRYEPGTTHCGRCGVALAAWRNGTGFCQRCSRHLRCPVCLTCHGSATACAACRAVLDRIHQSGRGDYGPRPAGQEARIARYRERARDRKPLFTEVVPCS